MLEKIRTKSVTKDMAKASPIILNQTSTTALVFRPIFHSGGIRGDLIRYRKEKGQLIKIDGVDFKQLQLNEGVHIELNTESLHKLVDHFNQLQSILNQEGVQSGEWEYIVSPSDEVILVTDKNKKKLFDELLKADLPIEFWHALQESTPEIADKIASGHIQHQRKKVLKELAQRLECKFTETSGSDSWQSWIYKYNWLFGVIYNKPIQKVKIALTGIMPDYLFPTVDGFVDVLEIKLPDMEVLIEDSHHKGSWYWSNEANKAIGQVINYLQTIETNALSIERHLERELSFKVCTIKPRGYILIGNSMSWSNEKKEALRKLNSYLHHIEVITYQDLINRGNAFISTPDMDVDN